MIKECSVSEINFDLNKYNLKCWKIDDNNPMYVFTKQFYNEEELNNSWEELNEAIAIEFQSKLENTVSIWNLYLVFLINKDISIECKYKIEKDKFSTRKVVVDNTLDVSDENIKKLISNHIIFDDLDIPTSYLAKLQKLKFTSNSKVLTLRNFQYHWIEFCRKSTNYLSDSKVYEELSNIDTLDGNKIDTILKSLEKDD